VIKLEKDEIARRIWDEKCDIQILCREEFWESKIRR
tara:strand:- start:71 stop:178 length:108 start_codon:yes stop_codon:yes gene_type:complete